MEIEYVNEIHLYSIEKKSRLHDNRMKIENYKTIFS